MDQELMALTQRERDRLDWLKQAKRKQMTQAKTAELMGVSERWVRKLLQRMKIERDRVVVHKLRGRPSNRRISAERREQIVRILSDPVYAGYGPTLASERLRKKHDIRVGREALRQLMSQAGLWRPRRRKQEPIHTWRERHSRFGELVQWDSSTHDWLEGRGPQLKLIRMIDDATSRSLLRFVEHDSVEENMRLLERWLRIHGRMVRCYTDKAGLFVTTEKRRRDRPGEELDQRQMPPTQIGRALRELGITHATAHSPQAKGRVERAFGTDQDRLVKGLREVQARTLVQANQYLEQVYEPWWEASCTVQAAEAADAHRPVGQQHDLAAILRRVELRQVQTDYTVQFQGSKYQILREDIVTGLRGAAVRIEQRLDGSLHMSFQGSYLRWEACTTAKKTSAPPTPERPAKTRRPAMNSQRTPWGQEYARMKDIPLWQAVRARG
jgi:DNA-binding CsgD family transcriptional regulator